MKADLVRRLRIEQRTKTNATSKIMSNAPKMLPTMIAVFLGHTAASAPSGFAPDVSETEAAVTGAVPFPQKKR